MVVDASVAAKWHLVDEVHAVQALALLSQFTHGHVDLLAPDQIRYEVASTLTNASRVASPRLGRAVAEEAIVTFLELGLQMVASNEVIMDAFVLVHDHAIAFYDALYLAVAQRAGAPLITADNRLYQRIKHLPGIVWIGDYRAADARSIGS